MEFINQTNVIEMIEVLLITFISVFTVAMFMLTISRFKDLSKINKENKEALSKISFDNFFETAGPYIDFVNVTTDGVPSGEDRLKVKKGYKVALYVQVMHDNLKRKLQADRIIKSLSSGF